MITPWYVFLKLAIHHGIVPPGWTRSPDGAKRNPG
jgi:hypothetical protein